MAIPSPTRSLIHLGPVPIHAYAICIIIGIVVCLWIAARRFAERGGTKESVYDVAGWAIVFGIIGGRLYHVVTDPELYFGSGKHPIDAVKIWDGGLGIWGAIALGFLGAWIGCRRHGVRLLSFADAVIPGVVLAQAVGRWGNWFNNELFGGPTSLPWKLTIHCMDADSGRAVMGGSNSGYACPPNSTVAGYFQPTFLYESVWCVALAIVLVLVDRKYRLGRGNVFAFYIMGYTAGRSWIEALRKDEVNHFLGLRLNDWTSIVVFIGALIWFLLHGGFHAQREASPYVRETASETENVLHDADKPDI
ncbi:MAG TPA: prolipoprotein diacylglyceryl transferase [Jatrophihabitans sp.]